MSEHIEIMKKETESIVVVPSKALLNCSASSEGEGTEEETLRVAILVCSGECMLRVEDDE